MPIGDRGGSGGGGLHFRRPVDSFDSTTLALARADRDTYFSNMANAAALAAFQGDQSLAIIVFVTGATTRTFETYLPGTVGSTYDATQWVERTDAVQGNMGNEGNQARFAVSCYANGTAAPTMPTGGAYDIATGVLTVPAGTTADPVEPTGTQVTYRSLATINPGIQTGIVTPVWSAFTTDSGRGATLTAAEIVTLLQALSGAGRLDGSAVKAIADALDTELGNPNWRTSGGATLTGAEIVTLLQALSGADRLDGSAVKAIADALDTELGNPNWRTSGGATLTGAEIVTLLQALSGAGRLDGSAVKAIADTLDTELGNTDWRTGGVTNLTVDNRGATTLDVASDTGTDATIPVVTSLLAGLMSAADKTVLDGIEQSGRYGGEIHFGAVDPVAADGLNRDTWINTVNGTLWKKAAGMWTNEYTFPSGTPDPGDHTRRIATSADTTLTESEVTVGTSSTSNTVTLPAWGAGVMEYIFVGVPEAENDITNLLANGISVFNAYEAYVDGSNNPIIVSGHKWWRTVDAQDGEFDVTMEIVQ